ncbi:hypothetical protein KAX35_01605, partial [candidate division WOR-3 bacterium]|nr:hypothetical protein [candidate division WOR-3 bacterium]
QFQWFLILSEITYAIQNHRLHLYLPPNFTFTIYYLKSSEKLPFSSSDYIYFWTFPEISLKAIYN